MTTVVVTGGRGFIGGALSSKLSSQGFDVISVCRADSAGSYCVNSYFDCPEGDVLIHLAEEADRGTVNRMGEAYLRESLSLTKTLSRRFEGRVIYASSAAVYGDGNATANVEELKPQPTDIYSELKLGNEEVILAKGGTVARISNCYGYNMAKNTIIAEILRQLPSDGPIVVRNGSPVRDFLCVDDLCSALSLMIAAPYNGVLNVGSGKGVSILELVRIMLSAANQSERNVISTSAKVLNSVNVLNISKVRKLLGWFPSRTLKEHLSNLIYSRPER